MKNLMHFALEKKMQDRMKQHGFGNGLPSADILELIPEFDITIENFTFLDDTSRVTDIALFKGLARQLNKCDYF
jgi:hypothetical protein